MKSIINKSVMIGLVFLSAVAFAQEMRCEASPDRNTYQQWVKLVGLDVGKEFVASPARKKQILEKYSEIRVGMSREEVEKVLGRPDYEQRFKTPEVSPQNNPDAKKRCGYLWAYDISKTDINQAALDDVAVFLSFDSSGRLSWASPINIKELKQKGSPL